MNPSFAHLLFPRLTTVLVLLLVGAGCQTTPKVDWTSRVGVYTHDQAVIDLGPPDRSAQLADGSTVAEWITQRANTHGYAAGGFLYGPGHYGPGPMWVETRSPEFALRLTFGPDGKLKTWKKLTK